MSTNNKNDEAIDPLLNGLTAKQQAALPLLVAGLTTQEAAERVGIHSGTISNWRKNSADFSTAEIKMRSQSTQEARRAFQAMAVRAVSEMARLLKEAENDRIRFEIARYFIEKSGAQIPPDEDINIDRSIDLEKVFDGLGVRDKELP